MKFYAPFFCVLVSTCALHVTTDIPISGTNNPEQQNDNLDNVMWRQSVCVIYGENVVASMINQTSKLNDEENRSQDTENHQSPVQLITPMVFESLSLWGHSWPYPSAEGNLIIHTLSLEDRVNLFQRKSNALFVGKREGQNLVITPANPESKGVEKHLTKIVDSPVVATLFTNIRYLGDEYPICKNYQEVTTGAAQGNITLYKVNSTELPLVSTTDSGEQSSSVRTLKKRESDPYEYSVKSQRRMKLYSYPYWPTLNAMKSIESMKNFGGDSASATSARGPYGRNFPFTSGLFKKFFPNSSPQLVKLDYQGPVIFKLGVTDNGPELTQGPPEENQMSPVFDYFFKRGETTKQDDTQNVISPVSVVQTLTVEPSSLVSDYTKPEAPISHATVPISPKIQPVEANTEKSETTPNEATEVPDLPSTTAAATTEVLSTIVTEVPEISSTEAIQTTEDALTEATETPEAQTTEVTQQPDVTSTETTETSEVPLTEATQLAEDITTEAAESTTTETTEGPSTETTQIPEDTLTVATETSDSQSTEATESSEGRTTEVTQLPEEISTETTEISEDQSTEATEILEGRRMRRSIEFTTLEEESVTEGSGVTEESTTEGSGVTEATEVPENPSTESTEIFENLSTTDSTEPSTTEGTDVTEPNEQLTTESQPEISVTEDVLFTDLPDQNSFPIPEETEKEMFYPLSTNETNNSQLDVNSKNNAEVDSNMEVPQSELLHSLTDIDPRQASQAIAIADAINAYESEGSPNVAERLHVILEATEDITGNVETPDETPLDGDENTEDDA
ncbi:uncharacterized protein LOC135167429 isoform X2 [Diachasmimorpha longicaudata]|uniref:uncharacterized protein LOC135167429 isoform X2 n=1 Tax=Diachasmimorpha longicaudata TaxID=58733 RepID=UPI0030B8C3C2